MSVNIWEDALENDARWKKEGMKSLLRKKNGVLNLAEMSVGEEMQYLMTKSQLNEALAEYAQEVSLAKRKSRTEADMDKYAAQRRRVEMAKNPPVMKKDTSLSARVSENVATSDVAHGAAVVAQEISDSYINPVGIMLRTYNYGKGGDFSTGIERVKARNTFERVLGTAAGITYEAIPVVKSRAQVCDFGQMIHESAQLGIAHSKLSKNPFLGKAEDVITRMKPLDGDRVAVQRGHVALNSEGDVVTHGKILKRATGSERNFGANKASRSHGMSKFDMMCLPWWVRRNKPTEIGPRGNKGYHFKGRKGEDITIATTPVSIDGNIENTLTSYFRDGEKKIPSTPFNLNLKK